MKFLMAAFLYMALMLPLIVAKNPAEGSHPVPNEVPKPPQKHLWGNAGGVDNAGGGGLGGAKCARLFPHCTLCESGFKACLKCGAEDGIQWDITGASCTLTLDFEDLALPYSSIFPVPADYYGLVWSNFWVMSNAPLWTASAPYGTPVAATSGNAVIWNDYTAVATISSANADQTFCVVQLQATSYYKDQDFQYIGYSQSGSSERLVSRAVWTQPTLVTFPSSTFCNLVKLEIGVATPVQPGEGLTSTVLIDDLKLG